MSQPTIVKGFDFTSAPKRKKPITCAHGLLVPGLLQIERIDCITDFEHLKRRSNSRDRGLQVLISHSACQGFSSSKSAGRRMGRHGLSSSRDRAGSI